MVSSVFKRDATIPRITKRLLFMIDLKKRMTKIKLTIRLLGVYYNEKREKPKNDGFK
jgi:hypothetical protein